MHKPLLTKTLTDLRAQILGWGIGMGLLLLLIILLYPSIGSTYGEMVNQLPEHFTAFFGAGPLDTLEGFLNTEFFIYAPMALAVFAILSGTGSIVGEENQGTLEILLAQPISRLRLVTTKMMTLVLVNGMVVAILIAIFCLAILFVNIDMSAGRIIGSLALLWPFLTTIAFLSMLLSLILSSRIFAGTIMAVLLVTSYVLGSLANFVSELEPLRLLYLTTYYQGSNALVSEVSLIYTSGLILIMLGASLFNAWLFIRRDIAVQRQIRLTTSRVL